MKHIIKIETREEFDPDPDLSYLGTYTNIPKEHHIDRKERGDQKRNEFRYFNLGCRDPDCLEQDYQRSESYNNGDWHMMGLRAVATIQVGDSLQRITSAGVYGVESDSDREHILELYREELAALKQILLDLHFTEEEIDEKMPNLS